MPPNAMWPIWVTAGLGWSIFVERENEKPPDPPDDEPKPPRGRLIPAVAWGMR